MNKIKKKFERNKKEQITEIIAILNNTYSDACCSLNYTSPFELVVALILAAQCTDNMVNKILPKLFKVYPSVSSIAKANLDDIEKIIKPCGFYITKAKHIISTANILIEKFNSEVPNNMDDLCSLSGIGRKSANIVLQECFNKVEGIAVDTHVTRLSYRIGFTKETIQEKIEKDLIKKVPKVYWNKINHIFVFHGRAICTSKKPSCDICPINNLCPKNGL